MDDEKIITLFFERDEAAISETRGKYGRYLKAVAFKILRNEEDSEECENDAYLAAWNAIPPQHPQYLSAFLAKIVRNLSVARLREQTAQKRGGTQSVLSELEFFIPDTYTLDSDISSREIAKTLDRFLSDLKPVQRQVFVCRYWRGDSIEEISTFFGFSESKVKTMLLRCRNLLREYLEKDGVFYE